MPTFKRGMMVLALLLAACQSPASGPMRGKVEDLPAFEHFIATQPTPAQFRTRYPDVVLVLPGDIASKELRLDRSRYFAELDAAGHITGGKFQ